MPKSESQVEKQSADKSSNEELRRRISAQHVEKRLRGAGVTIERCAEKENDTKACYNHQNQRPPTAMGDDYVVFGGRGLVIFDIDVPAGELDQLPDWVRNLPSTLTVQSPHGGFHLYYTTEQRDDTLNIQWPQWGSVRSEGLYVVGAGSTINHEHCGDGKDGCPGQGTGRYTLKIDQPIATLTDEQLNSLNQNPEQSRDDSSKGDYAGEVIDLPDSALADEGEQYICTDFRRRATELAANDIMDFLRGGTGSYQLRREDGTGIDQSAADYYTLDHLYGAFRFWGEEKEDARRYSMAVFKRYCWENRYDKTGNLRKWLRRGEAYLQEQMDAVQREFDFGDWHRWRRRQYEGGFDAKEQKPWADPNRDGEPSSIALDTIRAATWILVGDIPPESAAQLYGLAIPSTICGEMCTPLGVSHRSYPTANEIADLAVELNPDREHSYHKENVKRLQRERGELAMAFCPSRPNGERYVYYPVDLPDPDDAQWVRVSGEKSDVGEVKQD